MYADKIEWKTILNSLRREDQAVRIVGKREMQPESKSGELHIVQPKNEKNVSCMVIMKITFTSELEELKIQQYRTWKESEEI
jgi:hypothetical protein